MTSRSHDKSEGAATGPVLNRRTALARLGLSAAVAYVAPTVLHLDRSANAVVVPSPCPRGKGVAKGAPWCRRRNSDHQNDENGWHHRRGSSGSGSGGGSGKD